MANKMTDSTARDLRRELRGVVMGAARGHSHVRVCPRDWLFLATESHRVSWRQFGLSQATTVVV